MIDLPHTEKKQVHFVTNFQDLLSTPFHEEKNAICWNRKLIGDFSEIIKKVELEKNIAELKISELNALQLTKKGQLAREILLNDMKTLEAHGASPILNLIKFYEEDDSSFFPTDVYSFHVDRSALPTDTFLCTYHGDSSEIIPNSEAQQKILMPEIRNELKKMYHGKSDGFEAFLKEYFFDLHYQAMPETHPTSLGIGNLWKLAIDHPESTVLPCVHRAPKEKNGQIRLLLIC